MEVFAAHIYMIVRRCFMISRSLPFSTVSAGDMYVAQRAVGDGTDELREGVREMVL
jgi:hypothetical protein